MRFMYLSKEALFVTINQSRIIISLESKGRKERDKSIVN